MIAAGKSTNNNPKSLSCKNERTTSGFAILLQPRPKPKMIPEMRMIKNLVLKMFPDHI